MPLLTGHGEKKCVREALGAGARGNLLKNEPFELPDAITAVAAGDVYVSKSLRSPV
jgi:DNA-binding NarL/FixJ family response regulator